MFVNNIDTFLWPVPLGVELTYNSTHAIFVDRKGWEINNGEFRRAVKRKAARGRHQSARPCGSGKFDFSYISKLENDRIPPPAADTIVAICRILNIEPVELLAASGKLPAGIHTSVGSSAAAQSFLQNASKMGLTEQEWKELTSSLHRLRES